MDHRAGDRKKTAERRPARRKAGPAARPHDEFLAPARRGVGAHAAVVELVSRRALLIAARQLLRQHVDRCTKCGSRFVSHEPAFVHCHYCGRMHRVANASLPAQELFEIRSGMRLAS